MKLINIKIILVIIYIFGIFGLFSNISLAENQIMIQGDEVEVETIPERPQPYENVTIRLNSYSTDINKAMIVWKNSTGVLLSGYGVKSYSFKTLGPDSLSIFNIEITPTDSPTIYKKVVVNPSEVVLLWEAMDGYTPPFYRGKSFITKEGAIKVVAIPNTKSIKSGNGEIVYTWKNNDNTLINASGYNKNSFIFKNSILNDEENISVSVSSLKNNYNSENSIIVPTVNPKIIFYKKSPSEGILYNKAIVNESSLPIGETTLVAEPYFLSFKNRENSFNYIWKMNNEQINTPSKKTEITLSPDSVGGYANISISIESINQLFQKVSGQIKLNL